MFRLVVACTPIEAVGHSALAPVRTQGDEFFFRFRTGILWPLKYIGRSAGSWHATVRSQLLRRQVIPLLRGLLLSHRSVFRDLPCIALRYQGPDSQNILFSDQLRRRVFLPHLQSIG